MTRKSNWIRWLLMLVLGWQLLSVTAPAHADTLYTVQPGDSLYRIAFRFGVAVQALMTANHLTATSLIYPGQQLVIPDGGAAVTPAPPAAVTASTYMVVAGDTLNRIAIRFGVSPQALMIANGLANANVLKVGQRLVIPAGTIATTPAPPAAPDPALAAPGGGPEDATPIPGDAGPSPVIYVVQSGDTLWGVSRRYNVSVAALKSINQMYNDYVHVGQQLVIPGQNLTPVPPPTIDAWPPTTLPAYIPAMSWHAKDLYARSIDAGHNPDAFSVAGDCNSDYAIFMGPVAGQILELGSYLYLKNTVSRFWGSIKRSSLAVHGGFNSRTVMDPMWANPFQCQQGEGPVACELRVNNSSIIFIGLGTGDQFAWGDFEKNYRWMLDFVLSRNVLPVLVTKADTLESQDGNAPPNFINGVIRRLGQEYDVPVMDLWLGVQDLKNGGLVWEGGHDFHLSNEGNTRHNLMTLQTLDVIWRNK